MERRLKDDKLLETVERIQKRIAERFPGSGLSQVAAELAQVTRESVARAAEIRRPDYWIRAGLVLVGLLTLIGIIRHFYFAPNFRTGVNEIIEFLDATKGIGVYLVAEVSFLITREIRINSLKANW